MKKQNQPNTARRQGARNLTSVRAAAARATYAARFDRELRRLGLAYPDGHMYEGSARYAEIARLITSRTGRHVSGSYIQGVHIGKRQPTLSVAEWLAEGIGFPASAWFEPGDEDEVPA